MRRERLSGRRVMVRSGEPWPAEPIEWCISHHTTPPLQSTRLSLPRLPGIPGPYQLLAECIMHAHRSSSLFAAELYPSGQPIIHIEDASAKS